MRRSSDVSSFKPELELLEDRIQPSFLLGGATAGMVTPLNNMVMTMQSAATDLHTQIVTMSQFGSESTSGSSTYTSHLAISETAYGKAVGDWQIILGYQHSIAAVSKADVNFINAVAFSEFAAGDPTDLIVLRFGPIIGLNVLSPFTTPVTQANSIVNGTQLQSDIAVVPFDVSGMYTLQTVGQAVTTPTF